MATQGRQSGFYGSENIQKHFFILNHTCQRCFKTEKAFQTQRQGRKNCNKQQSRPRDESVNVTFKRRLPLKKNIHALVLLHSSQMIPFGATVQMFDVIKTISNPLCVSVAYELLFILMSSDQSRNCVQCVGGWGGGTRPSNRRRRQGGKGLSTRPAAKEISRSQPAAGKITRNSVKDVLSLVRPDSSRDLLHRTLQSEGLLIKCLVVSYFRMFLQKLFFFTNGFKN